jgi:hypothetical protein
VPTCCSPSQLPLKQAFSQNRNQPIQPCLIRQVNNYLCRAAPAWLASRPALPLSAENSFYSSPFTFYNSHNPTIDFASSKPEYYA